MKITKLLIKNFRNHECVELSPEDLTKIIGQNGRGKTSIGEAIVWLFEGTDTFGKTKQDERLMKAGQDEMYVGANVVMDSGLKFRIERTRSGGKQTLKVNSKTTSQEVVNARIGDLNVFMSAFWPGFFGDLTPQAGRETLMKLLPPVSPYAVIDNLLAPQEAELLKEYDENQLLVMADKLMQGIRKDTSDLGAEIQKLQGRIDETKAFSAQSLVKDPTAVDHKVRLANLERELIDLKSGNNRAAISERIATLRTELAELKSDTIRLKLENEVQSLGQKVQTLLSEVNAIKAQHKPLPDTHCPTCKQELPAEQAEKLVTETKAFNQDLRQRFNEKQTEGKQAHAAFKTKEAELKALPDNGPRIQAINTEIAELQKELARPTDEVRVKEITEEMAKLREEERQFTIAQNEVKMKNKQITDARERAGNLLDELTEKQASLTKLQSTLSAMSKFRVQFAEQQIAPLTSHLKKTVLQLYDMVQSTGELKPVFQVYWINKDGLQVPYKGLSTSEKIRCDLEISLMISKVRGENYPVFVDTAGEVNFLEKEEFAGQVFAAYASETTEFEISTVSHAAAV